MKKKIKTKKLIKKKPAKKVIINKAIKKIVVKKEGKLVGKITHYFSEINVVVINLLSPLKIGEKIRIIGGQETDFDQKVTSLQIDHKPVKTAKKGASVGMKVDQKVHEGYKVYKIK